MVITDNQQRMFTLKTWKRTSSICWTSDSAIFYNLKGKIQIIVTLVNRACMRSQSFTRKNISRFSILKLLYRTDMNGKKLAIFLYIAIATVVFYVGGKKCVQYNQGKTRDETTLIKRNSVIFASGKTLISEKIRTSLFSIVWFWILEKVIFYFCTSFNSKIYFSALTSLILNTIFCENMPLYYV